MAETGDAARGDRDLSGLTAREAARSGRFWILVIVLFLVAITVNGTAAHVVPLLTDAGISPASAAATMGVFGLATMIGRLLAGYLVDRFFASYVATVLFLAPVAGFAFLATATGILPTVGVILLGLGLGTEIDLIAFLVSRYFRATAPRRARSRWPGCCSVPPPCCQFPGPPR